MAHKRVLDTWERGSPYEQYVGRWSRRIAPLFLSWLRIPAGRRWLDVGCGTGALCAAIVDRCSASSVAGVEPSGGFLKTAKENLAGRVAVHQGSATAIQVSAPTPLKRATRTARGSSRASCAIARSHSVRPEFDSWRAHGRG